MNIFLNIASFYEVNRTMLLKIQIYLFYVKTILLFSFYCFENMKLCLLLEQEEKNKHI